MRITVVKGNTEEARDVPDGTTLAEFLTRELKAAAPAARVTVGVNGRVNVPGDSVLRDGDRVAVQPY